MQGIKIGNFSLEVPVIQGGMAVKVSRASLSAAVANAGGLGVIGASGLSAEEVVQEIREARKLSRGALGINIMVAVSNFTKVVEAAVQEKIDVILAGAGFSKDVFRIALDAGIDVVPVVSSAKVAVLAEKLGAAAVVVEGTEAGGHLGTDRPVRDILPEVIDAVSIPVFAAGGLIDGKDMADVMRRGAVGVQMGSRFV
ncbi:MAG: nitronate monooxygenase, partial [Nitrospirota bacterium]|nr:nitronate monooxygenase [Nitrospirota bacterium]